jgi:hypothetical protein
VCLYGNSHTVDVKRIFANYLREIFVKGEIAKAVDKGDFEAVQQLEKQLVSNRKSLEAEKEEKKDKVRQAG